MMSKNIDTLLNNGKIRSEMKLFYKCLICYVFGKIISSKSESRSL